MNTQHDNKSLSALYDESVARERQAWQALQAHQPGTPGRARAWEAWSEAIVQTNQAWRKLSASRVAQGMPYTPQPGPHDHAAA